MRWLSVFFSTRKHAGHLWLGLRVRVGTSIISDPASVALYRRSARKAAGAVSRISRLSPALARTFRPGASAVPRAVAVMFLTFNSSVAISAIGLVVMAQQELDALHHCAFALHSHLVLVTRFRRKALTRPMLDRFDVLARERVEA
ncbi:hypothetical protein [Sabulicella rubraurantiaca]|uniref:hypothetical protein n=1 Tax=Sabulicella rubraurantiaca TaxID=2811429 RepID=UPI001F25EE78|nr:hypothetical protein [Sabulicella rubraurantiaca]